MRSNMWKRMMALACAGIMVFGGSSWSTVSVKAAEEAPSLEALSVEEAPALEAFGVEEVQETYAAGTVALEQDLAGITTTSKRATYQADKSESGYVKLKGLTAYPDTEEKTGEDSGRQGHGYMAVDEDTTTFWHTQHAGGTAPTLGENGNLNKISISIPIATTVTGVTYLPRQHTEAANGTVYAFNVEVKRKGKDVYEKVGNTVSTNFDTNYEKSKETEVVFSQGIENVTDVRIVVTSGKGNMHITAAEIGVLTTSDVPAEKIEFLKFYKPIKEKVTEKDYSGKAIYDEAQVLTDCEALYNNPSTTSEMLEAKKTELSNQLWMFNRERGKGYWLSDLAIEKAICGWKEDALGDQPRVDSSWKNNPLQMLNQKYKKGFGTHAGTSADANYMIFDLGAGNNYKVFEAVGGMQQGRWGQGTENLEFKVYIQKEGETEYTCVWSNKDDLLYKVPGTEEERVIDIRADIRGARKLKLEAEGKKNGGGHVNWSDAKLYTTWDTEDIYEQYLAKKAEAEAIVQKGQSGYTESSFQALQNETSKAALELTNTTEELNAQIEAFNTAINNLAVEYTVNVHKKDGTVVKKPGAYNDLCELNSTDPNFKGWRIGNKENGPVISTNKDYSFYISGNMDVYEICDTEVKQEAKLFVTNTIITPGSKPGRSDIKIVGQLILPTGKNSSNYGLNWATSRTGKDRMAKANAKNEQGQFSLTLRNVPNGRSAFARLYAMIDGMETIYSSPDKIEYKTFAK